MFGAGKKLAKMIHRWVGSLGRGENTVHSCAASGAVALTNIRSPSIPVERPISSSLSKNLTLAFDAIRFELHGWQLLLVFLICKFFFANLPADSPAGVKAFIYGGGREGKIKNKTNRTHNRTLVSLRTSFSDMTTQPTFAEIPSAPIQPMATDATTSGMLVLGDGLPETVSPMIVEKIAENRSAFGVGIGQPIIPSTALKSGEIPSSIRPRSAPRASRLVKVM